MYHNNVFNNCVHCNLSLNDVLHPRARNTSIKLTQEVEIEDENASVSIADAIFYIYGAEIDNLINKSEYINDDSQNKKSNVNSECVSAAALCNLCSIAFTEVYRAHWHFNKLSSGYSLLHNTLKKSPRIFVVPVKQETDNGVEHFEVEFGDDFLMSDNCFSEEECDSNPSTCQNEKLTREERGGFCSPGEISHHNLQTGGGIKQNVRSTVSNNKKEQYSDLKAPYHKKVVKTNCEQMRTLSVGLDRLDQKIINVMCTKNEHGSSGSDKDWSPDLSSSEEQSPVTITHNYSDKGRSGTQKTRLKKGSPQGNKNLFRFMDYVVCCKRKYKTKPEFNQHKEKCHRGKRLKESCAVCERAVVYQYMGRHMRENHDMLKKNCHPCSLCNKIFIEEELLRQHEFSIHRKTNTNQSLPIDDEVREPYEVDEESDEPYEVVEESDDEPRPKKSREKKIKSRVQMPCEICGKLIMEYKMATHLLVHDSSRALFKCTYCDKSYLDKYSLKIHQRTHDETFEYFTCDLCKRKFQCAKSLRIHEKVHHGGEQFECPQCGKIFACLIYLKAHESMHLDTHPFVCEQCGKPFYLKKTFDRHVKQHADHLLDRELFKCPECGKYMKDGDNLKKHLRRFHGPNLRLFTCEICGKTTKNMTNMRYHQKIHDPMRNLK